ncbi:MULTISPECIES: ABC transporter permease [Bosea]|jgi:peptide/nickel transport system permease protein|uniref:Peptide/nickel transport system permease protein n=1 Tax=Bosea robiniae TaxID=1036780 RepID=A0ABY0P713_9HYPH|nr:MULTISPECIES: ABC transporter permease [Bosea]TQI74495.1 peptide/nickel transport system permease protein [Bosea sp. AK1]SDH55218.1 peptide/nickel transport system permease protein [Bosea robiniae]
MNWLSMVANRLLWFVPTLVGLLAIVFVLSRVIPVDPAVLAAGENSSPEQVQQVRERFGFDKPLPVQFVNYLRDIAQGNLGVSLFTQQPIIDDLKSRLPATLELTIFAVLIAGFIGIPLGVLCGLHRNSWIDHVLRVVTVSGLAVASFWLAMQFQFLFSMKLGWLPLSGRIEGFPPETVTGLMLVDAMIEGDREMIGSAFRHIVLPTLTLALPAAATVVRFTRNGVIGVIGSPSVAYQTAMGLPRRLIVWKYVLRMALTATVTQLGLIFGILLAGAVVVETVFDWPGLGAYAVRSILQSDYNAVMGFTLCTGALFVLINLLVDMLQAAIDPRGAA